jgi:hypothetical protein
MRQREQSFTWIGGISFCHVLQSIVAIDNKYVLCILILLKGYITKK